MSGDFKALQENMGRNDFVLNYPWGFPVALTPVIGHFPAGILFIKKYIYAYFLASLPLVFLLFRRRNKQQALLAVLLMAASPFFWYFKNYIFSDLPNLFFVLLTLLLIQRTVVRKEPLVNPYLDSAFTGIAAFISFTMRTQSFVLLIALGAMQALYWKREPKQKPYRPSCLM